MKLAIVGSRSIDKRYALERIDSILADKSIIDNQIEEVISGGAKGPDEAAELWAEDKGKDMLVLRPDWNEHNEAAGPKRNSRIVRECDSLIAFWDGESSGTEGTIEKAKKEGCLLCVVRTDTKNIDSYQE